MTARKRSVDPTATKQIRCAVYTRKSTDEGLDSGFSSLDAQREAGEAYIASQKHEGWTCLPDRYDDGGFSGGNVDRPGLKRLLDDVKAGRIDVILVYKVDRLSRSLLDFARIIGILDAHGVSFVSVTQQFNTSSSMGRLTLNVLLSFAQFERETIAERTRDKMSAARRKGKWTGGPPILGFDIDPAGGRLLVNEAEAAAVRTIFGLYLDRQSLLDTARELNRRGITTKRRATRDGVERGGQPWDKTRLRGLLANVSYTGRVNFQGTIYTAEHAAIVDLAVWDRVQRLLRRNGRAGGRATRNKHGALLLGLLHCASCGAAMTHTYTAKSGRRYRYYCCTTAQKRGRDACPTQALPAGEIERFVVDRIRSIGTDAGLLAEVLKQLRAGAEERAEDLTSQRREVEADLKRMAAEVKRLVGTMPKANGKRAAVTARLEELNEKVAAGELRLADIRREESMLEPVAEADLVAALQSFDGIWETLAPRKQARIIHLLVERVTYNAEREVVSVTFRPGGIKALAAEGAVS